MRKEQKEERLSDAISSFFLFVLFSVETYKGTLKASGGKEVSEGGQRERHTPLLLFLFLFHGATTWTGTSKRCWEMGAARWLVGRIVAGWIRDDDRRLFCGRRLDLGFAPPLCKGWAELALLRMTRRSFRSKWEDRCLVLSNLRRVFELATWQTLWCLPIRSGTNVLPQWMHGTSPPLSTASLNASKESSFTSAEAGRASNAPSSPASPLPLRPVGEEEQDRMCSGRLARGKSTPQRGHGISALSAFATHLGIWKLSECLPTFLLQEGHSIHESVGCRDGGR